MHFFIYNPYSIVKETQVAETNAGGNLSIVSTACPADEFRTLRKPATSHADADTPVGASRGSWLRVRLVELIGIEPTTLCLQSRCSPS